MKLCTECGFSMNEALFHKCIKCGGILDNDLIETPKNNEKNEIKLLKNSRTIVKGQGSIVNKDSINPLTIETSKSDRIIKRKASVIPKTFKDEGKESEKVANSAKIPEAKIAPVHERKKKINSMILSKDTLFGDEFIPIDQPSPVFELRQLGSDKETMKFYDDKVEISRSDLDDTDLSVSSKTHAIIEKDENGDWTLDNVSSNGALFIRVKGKIRLCDNDIIIIGKNQAFTFKSFKNNQ